MAGSNPKSLRDLTMENIAKIVNKNLLFYLEDNNEYSFADKMIYYRGWVWDLGLPEVLRKDLFLKTLTIFPSKEIDLNEEWLTVNNICSRCGYRNYDQCDANFVNWREVQELFCPECTCEMYISKY